MPDEDFDAQAERMLQATLGGMTPHEALLQASLDDKDKVAEREAAIAKNRERALMLLAAIEKTLGRND